MEWNYNNIPCDIVTRKWIYLIVWHQLDWRIVMFAFHVDKEFEGKLVFVQECQWIDINKCLTLY